ncbi:MAG: NAD(P)/FAD-dependent oxidoreductase [Myxococcota bacterium]
MGAAPVVIAGGGPGGSATAVSLRRRGVDVVLLDRAVFPRDKVCGDVVLPEAQAAIAELGLDGEDLRARGYPCTGSRYVTTNGAEVSGVFRDTRGVLTDWWIVKRSVLDHWLLQRAKDAGAEVREGWEVGSVIQDGAGRVVGVNARKPDGTNVQLDASLVVGADGASSAVARSLGVFTQKPEHLCLAARAYVTGLKLPEPYLEIFTTERSLPGCAWILPVGPDEANIGVGIIKADVERLGKNPRQMFEELREQVPLFAERLKGINVGTLKGWSLPGSSEGRPIVGNGHVLVGDAGAMVDPFTGHGIHHALMAGSIAGQVISEALQRGDVSAQALMPYDQRCRERFLGEAELGYRLQRLHAKASLMRMATRFCGAHPGMRWAFLALLGHAVPRHTMLTGPQLIRALMTRGPSPKGNPPGLPAAKNTEVHA